ncbi:MAG: hypothetical protein M3P85_01680 [Actinomycetota bacterium]|nr:hypothetical protein [Actinomycetota bacterium]
MSDEAASPGEPFWAPKVTPATPPPIGLEDAEELAQRVGWVPTPVEEIEDEILAVEEERRFAAQE